MMNSVRGAKVLFLLLGMLFLGGCAQTGNDERSSIAGDTANLGQDTYGYSARTYPLKNYDTSVSCVFDSSFYYIEEEYGMDEAGNINKISTLCEGDWQQGSAGRELGEIDASVRYMAADDAGKLYLLTEKWENKAFSYEICLWESSATQTESGRVTEAVPLDGCPIQFPWGLEAVDGVILLWDSSQIYAFNAEGQPIWTYSETEILDICCSNESLWVCLRTDQGDSTAIRELDYREGSIKHRWDDIAPYDIEQIAWKAEGELWFLNSRTGLASYQLDTDAYEQVFSWMDAGVSELFLQDMVIAEKQILVTATDKNLGEDQIYAISYGPLPKEEEKQEIVFAMQWMDDVTARAIVEFNRSHSDYRIVAKTCTEQEYYEDYRKKIDMEMATGEGADIFILPADSYENYRSKGLLLDLAPYFAKDDAIDENAFVEKAWERYRVGESLYALPMSFSLVTAVGRQDVLRDDRQWTIAEMMRTVKEQPQITELLSGGYKEDVLLYCCRGMLSQEADIDFEGDAFLQILEFVNEYGKDVDSSQTDNEMYHLMTEESLLMEASFGNVESIQRYHTLLNSEIRAVGYPAKEPISCYLYPADGVAVRADTPYAEQAWEFVKLLLSESYQASQYSFPVSEAVLEERLEEAIGGGENHSSVTTGIIVNGEYLEMMPPTPQDAKLLQTMIADSVPYPYEADVICDIILEEAASYFMGQKTAPEVAKIIQNRVQLYLDE